MTASNDDLANARLRIYQLEQELARGADSHALCVGSHNNLVRPDIGRMTSLIPIVVPLAFVVLALRVPSFAAVALGAMLVALVLFYVLRGTTIMTGPNELALLKHRNDETKFAWLGPGRVVRLARGVTAQSVWLNVTDASFLMEDVTARDGIVRVQVFAIVAVRRDNEGMQRAARVLQTISLAAIARAALRDAVRSAVQDACVNDVVQDKGITATVYQTGGKSLMDLGIQLIHVGLVQLQEQTPLEGRKQW